MSHFTEGVLQSYLDEEVAADARAQFHAHMSECAECAARLQLLREANASFALAVSSLDLPAVPSVGIDELRTRARQQEWQERRRGASQRWSRAAIVVIGLSAVAAAAVPGSPFRDWLIGAWNALAEKEPEIPQAPAVQQEPEAPAESPTLANVTPVSGRVRIGLQGPARGTRVQVTLVDAERATVETAATRFRSGPGWLEAVGVTGEVRIALPRGLASAYVEVDGRVYVAKEGDNLRYMGPATADRSDSAVTFKPAR
jgi:anti-sigma factor RsiW